MFLIPAVISKLNKYAIPFNSIKIIKTDHNRISINNVSEEPEALEEMGAEDVLPKEAKKA